jgi:hypothetical protein
MSDDRRFVYLGTFSDGGLPDVFEIPREILQSADQKLAAERAIREAEAEKAKPLQSVRTSGKLRRLLGLGGD